jgi:hypothetical protein
MNKAMMYSSGNAATSAMLDVMHNYKNKPTALKVKTINT